MFVFCCTAFSSGPSSRRTFRANLGGGPGVPVNRKPPPCAPRRTDMTRTTRALAKLTYALFGTLFLAAGAATLLVNTGLLPDALRNCVVHFAQDNPGMLHIIQEFGSLMVLAGLLTFWFIAHYEQSQGFHWAMTAYW